MTQERPVEAGPRWRRRKATRPAEITAAALEVFAERGFAAARLEEVARRAGVAKGSIYLYFATKEALLLAVVRSAIVPHVEAVRGSAEAFEGPLAELTPRLLSGAAGVLRRPMLRGFVRMVIGESRAFPDIARIWRDEVVAPVIDTVSDVIARAQARCSATIWMGGARQSGW
jgi:AcrR family transcriptional regulator